MQQESHGRAEPHCERLRVPLALAMFRFGPFVDLTRSGFKI